MPRNLSNRVKPAKRYFHINFGAILFSIFFTGNISQAADNRPPGHLPDITHQTAIPLPPLSTPYPVNDALLRAEDLFQANNYREALIYYFESIVFITDPVMKSKVHFRLAECLEGVRRFEYAEYHYKLALRGKLPEALASRALYKVQHLPQLAQHEEAMRLFNKAQAAYKRRDVRNAIDDYLASLRLEPGLMAQDESGLIDDAIQYLTYLSESKDKEPDRLLKLATLLELKGETDKAVETLKQILIIYPNSKAAAEAEEKVTFFSKKRNTYLEIKRPNDTIQEVTPKISPVLLDTDLSFTDPGILSKELTEAAYTFKASNEQNNIPNGKFEVFSVVLGRGANQKEFLFRADEGIPEKTYAFDDGSVQYVVKFREVDVTTAYIQDIYGEGPRPAQLFRNITLNLTITKKA
ncbi:MAG: tetratricopeptide repeat protein [Candidatus Riflebacteria bacterium]|nr:tetratricopeptide repeat protein [Candidatus Riflebacteria bacterium]